MRLGSSACGFGDQEGATGQDEQGIPAEGAIASTGRPRTARSLVPGEFDERRAKMERLRGEGIDPYPPVSLWDSARASPTCSPRTTRRAGGRRASRVELRDRRAHHLAQGARQDRVPGHP